ncbi:hypothetical protein LIER_10218 [Lithospermum erythrorhizon]|uniref:Uncharacterized protein n=1 Tax=Lithospermum erythrorhizon TaxID=34254 RepID=A0AAV3PK60_LITER
MDAQIIRNLLKCNLSEEEGQMVQLEEEDLADGLVACEASMFVAVLCLKEGFISIKKFSMAMSNGWNCKELRVSRAVGSILYVFFPSLEEKKRVIRGGTLIQMRGLKDEFYTKEVALKLASFFHGSETVEQRKDKFGVKFFRIMVWIHAPLEKSWVEFTLDEESDSNSCPRVAWRDSPRLGADEEVRSGSFQADRSPTVLPGFQPMLPQNTSTTLDTEVDADPVEAMIARLEGVTDGGDINVTHDINDSLLVYSKGAITLQQPDLRGEDVTPIFKIILADNDTWTHYWFQVILVVAGRH